LPGGFLGVNANITVGLVWLSAVLTDFKLTRPYGIVDIQVQAGGDDFCILIQTPNEPTEAISYIRSMMENYIGFLKELHVTNLDDHDDGILEGCTFCRKRVFKRADGANISLRSELSVPIPEILTMATRLPKLEQFRKWRELDLVLKEYEEACPTQSVITGTLRALFLRRYPEVRPLRVESSFTISPWWKVYLWDNRVWTHKSLELIAGAPPVVGTHLFYLLNLTEYLTYMLSLNRLQMRTCYYCGEEFKFILAANEVKRFNRERRKTTTIVDYEVDEDFYNLLIS
jgi:hypothetical protein